MPLYAPHTFWMLFKGTWTAWAFTCMYCTLLSLSIILLVAFAGRKEVQVQLQGRQLQGSREGGLGPVGRIHLHRPRRRRKVPPFSCQSRLPVQ